MTNKKREPKGTKAGGQFAPDANPESTVELPTDVVVFQQNQWVITPEGRTDQIAEIYMPVDEGDEEIGYRLVHFNAELYVASQLREPTSAETKEKYRAAIHEAFSVFGSDASRYRPNDYGCELLADSSIEITGSLDTHNGQAWTGILRVGKDELYVENRGDGGSNIYRSVNVNHGDDGKPRRVAWMIEKELTERVQKGFDGLQEYEALDDFCSIVEVVGEGKS